MRLFIAVDLPSEVKQRIGKFISEIKKKNIIRAKFVEQANLHISLKFLGEVRDVDKIKAELAEIKVSKFRVRLKGIGAFPSQNYVRVLWVGIEKGVRELGELYKKITDKVRIEDRHAFSGHLTIARVKAVRDKKALKKFFVDKDFGEFEAKEFKLIKSTLTPKGPIYEEIKLCKL